MIYFIESELSDHIKIGYAKDVDKRVRQLALPGVEVLATCEGDKRKEKELHARFASANVGGEWYEPAPELLSFIEGLQGSPSAGVLPKMVKNTWEQIGKLAQLIGAAVLLAGCGRPEATATVQGNPVGAVVVGLYLLMMGLVVAGMVYKKIDVYGTGKQAEQDHANKLWGYEYRKLEAAARAAENRAIAQVRPTEFGFPLLVDRGNVLDPGLGATFTVAGGLRKIDEKLSRPELVRRALAAAQGWPRVGNEQEPLPALEAPDVVEADWLPVLSEYSEVTQDE